MNVNQFAVYQLKSIPETRGIRFHDYEYMKRNHLEIRIENYTEVYLAAMQPSDTPQIIREQFQKNLPKEFKGHSVRVSDVLVLNKAGITTAYYVNKEGFVVLAGFIHTNSSGALIAMDTSGFHIEGKQGSWMATDEIVVDGRQFFLMSNEQYGNNAAFAVVDAMGKIAAEDTTNGFDDKTIEQIRTFLHPELLPQNQKPVMENWQKYYENGEYLRTAEITEEQNYNMIDGRINNQSKKTVSKERPSVLKKLRQKQAEIATRSGKQPQQLTEDMERNRR